MTNHGDDCYFYYYSTCTKGDSCPFRHCEAAMGSETVCTLWQEDRCFRKICKFRHMEIKKKRNEIPCYWENQPAGCQKPHCAFHHEKPRVIDGMFVPPSKAPVQRKDVEEEPAPVADPPPPAPVPVANPANPQLRGVIKAETLENVPSPTHPPVVINPADDEDEDEDDQFSEEGDESSSRMMSPRKVISSTNNDDSLNFGIRTLEEIRLRKALKANLKKAGQTSSSQSQSSGMAPPPAQHHNGSSGEKENIKSFIRPSLFSAREDAPLQKEGPVKRRVAERLGKRKVTLPAEQHFIVKRDVPKVSEPPLKRTLAERLGGKVDCPDGDEDPLPQKAVKAVRDRLGLPTEPAAPENEREAQASGEIRIKTLEEIRQEKAAKSQGPATAAAKAARKAQSPAKRTAKPPGDVRVKTFSELLRERKRQQEEEALQRKQEAEGKDPAPPQGEGPPARRSPQPQPQPQPSEVRVKTLEEIRKEKAARMQAKEQEEKAVETTAPPAVPKRRILRLNKAPSAVADNGSTPTAPEASDKPAASTNAETGAANGRRAPPGRTVKVKTFQEIMQEKRLRRQQGACAAAGDRPSPPPTAPEEAPTTRPLRQRAAPKTALPTPGPHGDSLKRRESDPVPAATSPKSAPAPDSTPPLTGPQARAASPSARAGGSDSPPAKHEPSPPVPAEAPPEGAAPHSPAHEEPPAERTRGPAPVRSPVHMAETKVRPKLNVKPSVVKAASQVKLGQKRKTPVSHRSAVAAVKPLNSAPSAVEDQAQEPSCKRGSVKTPETAATSVSVEAEAPVRPQAPGLSCPGTSGPPQAGLHRPPNAEQSPAVTEPGLSPAKEPPAAPQSSPTVRTPLQPKPRRQSTAGPRSTGPAALDDLDELMNEFADDPLDGEMELDPAKDEDDLLLELSEMIDS